jgi:topoisomerase-4 subunit A
MATSIPPHNAAELCDAALHLIDKPNTKSRPAALREGPGLSHRRHVVDSKESITEAYMTGRGSFLCARNGIRKRARGAPGYRRHRNSVAGAEIAPDREAPSFSTKLLLVGDIRDESAEDVRVVIEPKSKNVDPEV